MTASEERLALAAEFPAASGEQWRELVAKVVGKSGLRVAEGAPVESALESSTYDGITLRPLYTRADATNEIGLPGLPPYVRDSRPTGAIPTGWDVRQRHADPDPAVTAKAVLADLEHGVTSVWLAVGEGGIQPADLPQALADVLLDLAPIVLDAGEQTTAAAQAMFDLYERRQVPASEVRGSLGADPLGLRARTGRPQSLDPAIALANRSSAEFPQLRAIVADGTPYHEAGGSEAEELGCTLATGVAYLRALTDAGLTVDQACQQLEFRYAATADQFLTIAKLRAARRLWSRVTEVSGASAGVRAQRQHAVTSAAMMTRRDPWVNMLRTTLACFGAGVGGAEAITVLPFDSALGLPDSFARRIARNTQALLMDESHVARVIDPAGGSWYVENLTDELAHAAWKWFQDIEKAGGLDSGIVQERIAATRQRRRDAIAHRRDPITGVSEFPFLAEKPVARTAAPAIDSGGLPRYRYAEDYERLRDRSDAYLDSTGDRPKIFLATLDRVAVHTARATFASNLFQAGGIEPVTPGQLDSASAAAQAFTTSGAKIACICSSDEVYAEHAADTAKALKEAGSVTVLLAGKPKDDYGVDGFVRAGSNAVEILTALLELLEVPA
ncbi:methylmalonyl-CoA mutase family protein [Fodinicola feengrottensis]|uniref:Methylmalonyl-CoA mutase family protein n=1 Tax=Fodinicola feengrottensis TaxID=435914 RepID=A0ABP4T1F6_9ACTN